MVCNHCSHPSHPTHGEHINTHPSLGGCTVCGCSKEQHGSGFIQNNSVGGTSGGGTSGGGTSSGGTSGGGGNENGGKGVGKSGIGSGEKPAETPAKSDTKPVKEVDDPDPDAWEVDGGEETPESEEVEEEDPFEEAEDPISENVQKPNNTNTAQNNNGGKGGIGKSYKLRRVFFDHDKWDIKPESIEELNTLKSFLTKNSDLCVRLDAHTDNNGTNEYNKELSRKRAQSVVDYLIGNGIDPVRLSAQGFGEELPVITNDTPEGREENRRVEFTKIGC